METRLKQPANSVVVLSSRTAKAVVSRRRPTVAKRNCFAKFEVEVYIYLTFSVAS